MNLNEKISIFKSATDPVPGCEVPILAFFESVQLGEYELEVAAIRCEADPDKKAKLKKQLPAATISGTFTHRKADALKKHSGFICLDFDGKQNPHIKDWSKARNEIGSINEVCFCALSVSGNGCFAVIPLAYPERHQSQFEALKRDFASIGLVIDTTPDVCRLRFMSFDSEAIINTGARNYLRVYQPPQQPTRPPERNQYTSDDQHFENGRDWLEKKGVFFTPGSRNNYIKELAGFCNRFDLSEQFTLSRCLEFAQPDFTAKEIESTVKSIYRNTAWHGKAKNTSI